ncbi:MAG TPA: nickel pincer cofactor biosynthesis protein LarC [Anaerolineaceae bacterium]|nr:nickel pincer cofactor biosynthesis protein LarC [Anaerolineaceae bacterium]
MSLLYCDCFSGISGDMFLAGLVDAGLPADYLSEQLGRLGLPGFKGVTTGKILKGDIQGTFLKFELDEDTQDEHEGHHHHAHQRNLSDIISIISASDLPPTIHQISIDIFKKLAEAEAKVHGKSVEEVHFHEVGAVDSILDIVGAAIGLNFLDIKQVYSSALPLGSGQVQSQHGLLPLPAPATLELLRSVQAPLVPSPATKELVTPTGAAILSTLAKFEQPVMNLKAIGIGAGGYDLDWPNVLRLMIGENDYSFGLHIEIETNIDDMNPQFYGNIMARLFELGALDVYFTPIMMKKNRPATKLSVIARQEDEIKLTDLLLRETSTLGVRVKQMQRHEAGREIRNISTRFGEAIIKIKIVEGQVIQISPEYDVCVKLAKDQHMPVNQVYNEVLRVGSELYNV